MISISNVSMSDRVRRPVPRLPILYLKVGCLLMSCAVLSSFSIKLLSD